MTVFSFYFTTCGCISVHVIKYLHTIITSPLITVPIMASCICYANNTCDISCKQWIIDNALYSIIYIHMFSDEYCIYGINVEGMIGVN